VARLDISRFDVIETPQMPYTHLFPLAYRARRAGVPLVVTWYEVWGRYWSHYVGALQAPIYRSIEILAAQLGTAATASSELTRQRLAQLRRGSPPERIPCGIDLERMLAAADRARTPTAGLVFAGRLIAHKRLDLAISAMAILAARMQTPPTLEIFGEGPAKQALEDQARRLGIERLVHFRGHLPSSDDLWTAIAGNHVAVQPSAREGFGLFPLEAMALGLPVVCCRSPETALDELVRDRQEGLWTEPEPHELAGALERILGDHGLREDLATRARARAAAYSWREVATSFESLFARLLA
jgi:glycosyltransferase involved in cell wall biosynthesis